MSPQPPGSGTEAGPPTPVAQPPVDDPDGLLATPPARPGRQVSRWWGISGGVVAAVAVLIFSWATVRSSEQGVTATTVGYKVVDDTQVRVSFDVTRPPSQPITCTITATDGHFTVVGTAQIVIPTGGEATTHHEGVVRTASRAVTGNVTDCVRT